jgi:hypothetical protein
MADDNSTTPAPDPAIATRLAEALARFEQWKQQHPELAASALLVERQRLAAVRRAQRIADGRDPSPLRECELHELRLQCWEIYGAILAALPDWDSRRVPDERALEAGDHLCAIMSLLGDRMFDPVERDNISARAPGLARRGVPPHDQEVKAKGSGANQFKDRSRDPTDPRTLADHGITKQQMSDWRKL